MYHDVPQGDVPQDNSENVPQGDVPQDNVPQDTSDKDITRGITIMRGIIRDRDRGITYNVDWNNDDQLIGPNSAKLTSYIGTLVRMRIPITTTSWKKGELDAKERIWTEIKVSYMVVVICFILTKLLFLNYIY